MKKRKIKIKSIIYMLLCLIVAVFWGFLASTNMIPLKLMTIGITVFLLWLIIIWIILFFKNKKKSRNIIGYTLSSVLLIIMGIIFFYFNSTLNFFEGFGGKQYKTEKYLVMVLKDSEYEKIEDIKNKTLGYIPTELNKISDALKELEEKISVKTEKYDFLNKMFDDLIDKKNDAVLIEESSLSLLEENSNYASKIKSIYTITVKSEIESSVSSKSLTKDTFSIYISGIDTYGSINGVSRSDVNIVATINPKTKQVLLVSAPRDYYVQLRGTTGLKDKLTHAGIYGVETSVGTLEDLLDVEIDYYFRVNFSTLEKVIDALGGVEVYSKYNFTSSVASGGTYRFTKGYNRLNGKQALSFSRERKNLPGGDRSRGENQQAVIDGVIRKVTSPAIITKYSSLLKSLSGSFQTNMVDKEITSLIKMQLSDMAKWNVTSFSLDGKDANKYTYSYQHELLYVMDPNIETVDEAIKLIDSVIAGNLLEGSYGEVGNVNSPSTVKPTPTPPPKPEEPDDPIEKPTEPEVPIKPDEPSIPGVPNEDDIPTDPTKPDETDPSKPTDPTKPDETDPSKPIDPTKPGESTGTNDPTKPGDTTGTGSSSETGANTDNNGTETTNQNINKT